MFGMLLKGQDIYWNLLLIRRIAPQRLQISPFVLLFRETKESGLKLFLGPQAKS